MAMIMVVDDEAGILRMYGKLLEQEGYGALLASDAEEATEYLIREPVDLVLLDINMPGIDGKTMYEVIREYQEDMKVIITSVYQLDDQKRMIRDAADYHDKSHGSDLLLEKIGRALA